MFVNIDSIFKAVRKGDASLITPETVGLTNAKGETLLHVAADAAILDKINPALLTPANLTRKNLLSEKGESPLDLARGNNHLWMLPKSTKEILFPRKVKPLRPYQQTAVGNAVDWLNTPILDTDMDTREGLVCLATGLGKTTVAASLINIELGASGLDLPTELAQLKDKIAKLPKNAKILWVVHRDELIKQAVLEIEALTGEPCEIEKADMRASGNGRVVIASQQSLDSTRLADLKQRFTPTTIYFDEAHHSAAPTCVNIKYAFQEAKIVNLTATNYRNDMRKPMNLGKELIYMTFKDGVRDGYLVRPHLLKKLELNLAGVNKKDGDYESKSLSKAMCREENIKACMELLDKYLPNQKSLIYAASLEHAKQLQERLAKQGITVGYVDGDTLIPERQALYAQLRAGKIAGIINYNVLLEGFDMPELTQIVNMRPTTSDVLSVQMMGRGGRPDPNNRGKTCFFVLDTADLKKIRRGMHAALPSDEALKQARALEGNPTLTRFQLFLSRFTNSAAVLEQLKTHGEPVKISTPEALWDTFYDKRDPERLQKLREVWDTANEAKDVKKIMSLLRFTSLDLFVKNMIDRGFLFSKDGETPRTEEELTKMLEKNFNDFAGVRDDTPSTKAADPVYKVLGDTENFIMEIERRSVSPSEQLEMCMEKIDHNGVPVYWCKPQGTSGRFLYLNYQRPDKSYVLLVRDKATGGMAEVTPQGPKRGFKFNLRELPAYCLGKSWCDQAPSPGQLKYLEPLLYDLRFSDADVERMLDPKAKGRLSKMAASVLLASYRFNEKDFSRIDKHYAEYLKSMVPDGHTNSQGPKPVEKPVVISSDLDPSLLASEFAPIVRRKASEHGLDYNQLYGATIKNFWDFKKQGILTREFAAKALEQPEELLANLRKPRPAPMEVN